MFQGSDLVTSMMRVRLTGFEPLHGHKRKHLLYPVCFNAHLKSVTFEKVADLGPLWRLMFGGPTKAEIIAIALEKLQIESGEIFADIGCGTGNVSKANSL